MNVLIIEDDLEDGSSIAGIFNENFPGFNIIMDSGINCLDILTNKNPHLVVLSLGISGVDCMQIIREIYDRSDAPIIALSSKSNGEVVEALENGAATCINKPVNQRIFAARVEALFRR